MKLRLASWNIEGRLSNFTASGKGSPDGILDEIAALDADVITLPEAYDGERGLAGGVERRIRELGYKTLEVSYKNGGPPRLFEATKDTRFMVLSKLDVASTRTIRLGNLRNMPVVTLESPESGKPLTIFGIHLDERSPEYRVRQATELAEELKKVEGEVVAMGDYNDMHSGTVPAKLFGSAPVRLAGNLLGNTNIGQLVRFAHGMAQGEAMKVLQAETALVDADTSLQPTTTPNLRGVPFMPSVRMIGIDHMMVTPGLKVEDFAVMKHDGGSDHRAISATIEIAD